MSSNYRLIIDGIKQNIETFLFKRLLSSDEITHPSTSLQILNPYNTKEKVWVNRDAIDIVDAAGVVDGDGTFEVFDGTVLGPGDVPISDADWKTGKVNARLNGHPYLPPHYAKWKYPIEVTNIFDGIVNPRSCKQELLPFIFYGPPAARYNENISHTLGYVGETITFVVFAAVGCIFDQTTQRITEPTVDRAADMHESMRRVVAASQNVGGVAREARLARVTPITFKSELEVNVARHKLNSARCFIEYYIEIDHVYKKTGL